MPRVQRLVYETVPSKHFRTWGVEMTVQFDPLITTASELVALLEQRKFTSVELALTYSRQIRLHNEIGANLKAIISVVPEDQFFEAASQLDRERRDGKLRGPLHGVPFIKVCHSTYRVHKRSKFHQDNIWTAPSFKLPTTSGAFAFKDAFAPHNADVVQKVST